MLRKSLAKSKRQYTQGLNNPAVALVRDEENLRHGPIPGFIEPCLAQARAAPPNGDAWNTRSTSMGTACKSISTTARCDASPAESTIGARAFPRHPYMGHTPGLYVA
jgi:hypothetical protein